MGSFPAGFGRRQPGLRRSDDETDYEHRHFVNLAAAAFLLVVGIAIVWTVYAFDRYETHQKCIASGRRDCVQIFAPPQSVRQISPFRAAPAHQP